jgi:hypothetical protein
MNTPVWHATVYARHRTTEVLQSLKKHVGIQFPAIISAYMETGERVFTPLDPIDPQTVGRANLKRMRKDPEFRPSVKSSIRSRSRLWFSLTTTGDEVSWRDASQIRTSATQETF